MARNRPLFTSPAETQSRSFWLQPRLENGTAAERGRWQLLGTGTGIHWPDLDEDISVEVLLQGQASTESAASIDRWLAARGQSKGR